MIEATHFDIIRQQRKPWSVKQRQSTTFAFCFFSSRGNQLACHRESHRFCRRCALRSTFFDQHNADPLQQFNRSVHAFRQENISVHVFVIHANFSGEENRRSSRRDL